MHPEHSAGREELAALLWGDRPDQQARLSLRQCILRMRADLTSAAADLLVLQDDAVGLQANALTTDALEFEALAGSTETGNLERACALYRGEFMQGSYETWVEEQRSYYREQYLRMLESLAGVSEKQEEWLRSMDLAQRILHEDPFREDIHCLIMRAHVNLGNKAAAKEQFETLRRLLERELGVEPSGETRKLYQELMG